MVHSRLGPWSIMARVHRARTRAMTPRAVGNCYKFGKSEYNDFIENINQDIDFSEFCFCLARVCARVASAPPQHIR
jgi:hypothetical protein